MSALLPLLIEISELTDRSSAAWVDDVRVGTCTLMRHVLSHDNPLHSFTVHDSRREDCVSICLRMAELAGGADDGLELLSERTFTGVEAFVITVENALATVYTYFHFHNRHKFFGDIIVVSETLLVSGSRYT